METISIEYPLSISINGF